MSLITKRNFVGRDILAMSLVTGLICGFFAATAHSEGALTFFDANRKSDFQIFFAAGSTFINYFVPSFSLVCFAMLLGKAEEAPYHVLTEILNLGYQFDGSDVASMSVYLSVTEIISLENYGADFTQVSPSGLNALVRSIANRENTEVYDYFLTKDGLVYSAEINNVRQVIQL